MIDTVKWGLLLLLILITSVVLGAMATMFFAAGPSGIIPPFPGRETGTKTLETKEEDEFSHSGKK